MTAVLIEYGPVTQVLGTGWKADMFPLQSMFTPAELEQWWTRTDYGWLDDLTAMDGDGNPVPGESLFQSDLSEEEALRKARRGPALGDDDEPDEEKHP